jgi:acetolactate decarboxylase
MSEIGTQIDRFLPSRNFFYAIRVHGTFSKLTTRAIPKLFPPYPPLAEAVSQDVVFPFSNVTGTVGALRCPAFVKGINEVG